MLKGTFSRLQSWQYYGHVEQRLAVVAFQNCEIL